MAQIRVEISQDNASPYFQKLKNVDLRPALLSCGEEHLITIQNRFDAETDPYGVRWKPRKEIALYSRIRVRPRAPKKANLVINNPNRPILFLSGRLRNSIIYQLVDNKTLLVGTNVIYAATHQFGDPSRGIPQRAYLDVNEEDRRKIREIFRNYLASL